MIDDDNDNRHIASHPGSPLPSNLNCVSSLNLFSVDEVLEHLVGSSIVEGLLTHQLAGTTFAEARQLKLQDQTALVFPVVGGALQFMFRAVFL